MLNVLGGFAQFEREVIAERVILAMERGFNQGKWMFQPPFGYRIAGGDREPLRGCRPGGGRWRRSPGT
jgi:DNA invertase Pin-like site-specific DNA recombinase